MNATHVPTIGQRQQIAKAQIAQAINGLSMQIYSKLAVSHIEMFATDRELNRETLKRMAKNAQVAAQMYFVGLGVVEE